MAESFDATAGAADAGAIAAAGAGQASTFLLFNLRLTEGAGRATGAVVATGSGVDAAAATTRGARLRSGVESRAGATGFDGVVAATVGDWTDAVAAVAGAEIDEDAAT